MNIKRRKTEILANITLKFKDNKLSVPRDILAEKSNYFRTLLSSTQDNIIELDENYEDFKELDNKICRENYMKILYLSHKYEYAEVFKKWLIFLKENNVPPLLELIQKFHDYGLHDLRKEFMTKYIYTVKSAEYTRKNFEILSEDCKTEFLKIFRLQSYGTCTSY